MTASEDFSHEYLEYLSNLIAQLDREPISKFADLLLTSRDSGSTTFFWEMEAVHLPRPTL